MANLEKIIKVTQEQYDILASGGKVGDYVGLQDNYVYMIEDTNEYITTAGGTIDGPLTIATNETPLTLHYNNDAEYFLKLYPNPTDNTKIYNIDVSNYGAGEVALSLPSKSGTFALTSDIPTALKNPFLLKFGSKTYDGSSAQTITLADLGGNAINCYDTSISDTADGAWTVSIPGITELTEGLTIKIRLKRAGASTCTLNLNGLGAKTVYFRYGAKLTTHYSKESVIALSYTSDAISSGTDRTGWIVENIYDSTNIQQLRKYYSRYTTKSVLYRLMICFVNKDNLLIPANNVSNSIATNKTLTTDSFDLSKGIYYYSSTTTVAAGEIIGNGTLYQQFAILDLRYSFNTGTTLTPYKPVYVVVTPTGSSGEVVLASNPIAQTIPTSNDGNRYVFLGYSTDNYRIELTIDHPVYVYNSVKGCYTSEEYSHESKIDNSVQLTGNQIINGVKTFNNTIINTYLKQGIIDTHPENNGTVIGYYTNDLAYLLKKGGTCVATNVTQKTSININDNWFDASPSYGNFTVTAVTDVVEIIIKSPTVYGSSTSAGIGFGNSAWRAKSIKFEMGYSATNTGTASNLDTDIKWVTRINVTNNSQGLVYSNSCMGPTLSENGTPNGAWSYIKITLTDWNNTTPRIAQIFTFNYNSIGMHNAFLGKSGGTVYGNITPYINNSYDLGNNSNRWASVHATTFYENGTSLADKYAAKTHTHNYLPLSGGTLTGHLCFKEISNGTFPVTSSGIVWNGSTDGAAIYYRVDASDAGRLVFQTKDDSNCNFVWNNTVSGNGDVMTLTGEGNLTVKGDITSKGNKVALDKDVVKLTGDQSISGTKTFTNKISNTYLTGGILDTHPEGGGTIISYYTNDWAYLLKRGYSAAARNVTQNTTIEPDECWFDTSPSYDYLSLTSTSDVVEIIIKGPSMSWTTKGGIGFGANAWRAKNVKIEVGYTATNTGTASKPDSDIVWVTRINVTNQDNSIVFGNINGPTEAEGGHSASIFSYMRLTLTNWNTKTPRIAQIFTFTVGSMGMHNAFLGKSGGNFYGSIWPTPSNTYDLGNNSNRWASVHATTLYENGTALANKYLGINGTAKTTNKLVSPNTRPTSANFEHEYIRDLVSQRLDVASALMTTAQPVVNGFITTYFWDNNGSYDSQLFIPNRDYDNGRLQVRYRIDKDNADTNWGSTWKSIPYMSDLDNYTKKSIKLSDNVDLNTVTSSGFYRLMNHTQANFPHSQMIVCRGEDTIAQMVFPWNSTKMFVRTGNGIGTSSESSGNWRDWKEVAFRDDLYNGILTLNTNGTGVSGSATFGANQSGNSTFTVTLDSSAAGNRAANKVVLAKAAGQIDSDKFTVTSAGTTKATMQYNSTEDCIEFIFA